MKKKYWRFSIILKPFLLFVANVAVFSYAMFQGGFVSWFLFYSVLVISLLSLSIMFVRLNRIHIVREMEPGVAAANQLVRVRLTLTRPFIHPFCFIRIKDIIPDEVVKGRVQEQGALFFFSLHKKLTYEYTLDHVQRGEHPFYFVEVAAGDLFGFFEKRKYVKVPSTLIVYPYYHQLKDWTVHSSGGQDKGLSFSRSFEEELSFAGVREYIPGDRITSIDWKHSARTDQLVTKQFESFSGETTFLLFNHYIEDKKKEVFERQIELCASLVNFFYEKGILLGFIGIENKTEYFTPSSLLDHYQTIYYYLAKAKEKNTRIDGEVGVEEQLRGCTAVIVTSIFSISFLHYLETLAAKNIHIIVCFTRGTSTTDMESRNIRQVQQRGIKVYQFTETFFKEQGEGSQVQE